MTHHILQELGFAVRVAGDELHGSAEVTPFAHVPGTRSLRTSVLASWADMLAGLLAARAMAPRVPVTLELDVHLHRQAPGAGEILAVGRTVKQGRSVYGACIDPFDATGARFAFGGGSFMAAPDASLKLPELTSIDAPPVAARLAMPLADRAGCKRLAPGVAELPRSADGLNSSNTVNGGLIALVAEEAVLSLAPGATLCSLGLRYLTPVRTGPAVATATVESGLGQVELRDAGAGSRLAVTGTARLF
jgi:acyl-coenzyme A thioesterase PaaI-like protein